MSAGQPRWGSEHLEDYERSEVMYLVIRDQTWLLAPLACQVYDFVFWYKFGRIQALIFECRKYIANVAQLVEQRHGKSQWLLPFGTEMFHRISNNG